MRQPDGSWVLNGEKRYIGNGSQGRVFMTFARAEVGGKDRHIALIVEKGMDGFEVGERYDTMGLRGNDLRRLYFNDVRVPPENVLGEPGEGFRIAMQILNNGRIGLGTGSVGAAKMLIDMAIEHVTERRQFGHPLADFELVQEKIGWMVSYLFGLESMCYLTTGLVDGGVQDYSLESAICKVAGTEFLWYRPTARCSSRAAPGYMRDRALREDPARHPDLPDLRGRQRRDALLHRALGASSRWARSSRASATSSLSDPIGSLGVLADYVGGRIRARCARTGSRRPTRSWSRADAVADQVGRLRTSPRGCSGSTAGRSSQRQFHRSASPTPSPTSTPRSRCSRA